MINTNSHMDKVINNAFNNYYNHEQKHYNTRDYAKPFKYNTKSDYIKGYNVSDNMIDKAKALYPKSNTSPVNCNITSSCNLFILKSYITSSIVKTTLHTDPKNMNKLISNQGNKCFKFTLRRLFVIPEMNIDFTLNQIQRGL